MDIDQEPNSDAEEADASDEWTDSGEEDSESETGECRESGSQSSAGLNTPPYVFGLVYELTPEDEAHLDVDEGIPWAYQKKLVDIEMWPLDTLTSWRSLGCEPRDTTAKVFLEGGKDSELPLAEEMKVLAYVDRVRTWVGVPKAEYVDRIVIAVKEAEACGVPRDWLTTVVLKGIHVYKLQEWAEETP